MAVFQKKVLLIRPFDNIMSTAFQKNGRNKHNWRNREKWDQYEDAVNEMIQKTSTTYAPWHILESVDKRYARIKALKIVIEELEKVLE